MEHSELFIVYNFDKKVRLGTKGDGGYVIGDLEGGYDCYISAGVATEESFSRDFIKKYGMTKENSFAFDGTINSYPFHYTSDITFYNENINTFTDYKNTDLRYLIRKYNSIFLKMDIEGKSFLGYVLLKSLI